MLEKKLLQLILIFQLILVFGTSAHAQGEPGNIKYISIDSLNNSYLRKNVQFDFYNYSGLFNLSRNESLDKIALKIDGNEIIFLEHRVDGVNRNFGDQYMESEGFIDGYKIRITHCKINEINNNELKVTLYLVFYNEKGRAIDSKSEKIDYIFQKSIINKILVRI